MTVCTSAVCSNSVTGLYWNSSNNDCLECQYPCLTCYTNDPTRCYSCGYGPSLRNNDRYCACKSGYYEDDV